jgi:sodium transport system ATP-binding protein
MIQAVNLTKVFFQAGNPFSALTNVSFTIQKGEVVGLLGPNGAGKTTTMRILCTLLKPSSGSAQIAGFDVTSQPDQVRRNLGFVSSGTGIYDRLSCQELLEYHGKLHGMDDKSIQKRSDLLFHTLGLENYRTRLGAKLSTGTRQKVSLARALIHDPPVLILDEPTAGLDYISTLSLLDTIKELQKQGKTILYSSHHCNEIERICDRGIILGDGKVRWDGDWRSTEDGKKGLEAFLEKQNPWSVNTPRVKEIQSK